MPELLDRPPAEAWPKKKALCELGPSHLLLEDGLPGEPGERGELQDHGPGAGRAGLPDAGDLAGGDAVPEVHPRVREAWEKSIVGWFFLEGGYGNKKIFWRSLLAFSAKLIFFWSSRVLGFRVHHPFPGPVAHLCDLEGGYGGVLGSKLWWGGTGIRTPDLLHASRES